MVINPTVYRQKMSLKVLRTIAFSASYSDPILDFE